MTRETKHQVIRKIRSRFTLSGEMQLLSQILVRSSCVARHYLWFSLGGAVISVIGMTVDQLAPSQVFGRSLISLSSIICLIAGTMALISAIRGRILCWE